ncbi:TetR/AcrR family transcriptional regulator [Shewanella waksmanii]|uniref:TetR/AcrR family transcriptional regulator n=1 Tax=Shewanella waksmanii TaxID=213783 RepID=UPI0037363039
MATDKKQALLDTALTLFVKQGFYATSTASIARQAGVATGTLFHHFASKDALMNHLYLSIKQEFADAMVDKLQQSGDLQSDARVLWLSAIGWAMENPLKQEFFSQYSLSPSVAHQVREQAMTGILSFIAQLIEQGQQAGLLANHPLALMRESCHGQYIATTRFFLDNPELWQDDVHREASFQLFWQSMRPLS